MNARREYERTNARLERERAYATEREERAAARFTRDDAGLAYGVDGAIERAASQWLADAGYQWDGREARDDDALAYGGYDVLPDSVCHIDGAPTADAGAGEYVTIDGFIYATDDVPAMMRERPLGVEHSRAGVGRDPANRFTPGWDRTSRLRLGGRNRRDGRDLTRTALAVGCDGAVLRVPDGADAGTLTAAYAYVLDTARVMRVARLAHERAVSLAERQSHAPAARRAHARATIDAHAVSVDVLAILDAARGTFAQRQAENASA